MKKRVISFLLVATMAFSVAACGGKSADKDSSKSESGQEEAEASKELSATDVAGMDVTQYVELGDYKDLEVKLEGDYSEDDDALNAYIDDMLTASYEKDDTQKKVKKDSIVNVDYLGKKDGVAFDGGAAEDVNIDVAGNKEAGSSGGYIDGFTSGLVGAKVGDVVDCDVTFPDNYGNADLAGQAVVFTFTVNYICKEVKYTHEDLTDEYVKANFDKDTVSDFRDYALEKMKSDHESAKVSEKQSLVVSAIKENCKVKEIPDEILQERIDEYKAQFAYGIPEDKTLEEVIKEQYNIDMDEFEKRCKETVTANLETEFIFLAIAEKEDLKIKMDEFEGYITNMINYTGDSSKADLYKHYGSTAEKGKAYLTRIYLCNQTLSWCVDSAKEA